MRKLVVLSLAIGGLVALGIWGNNPLEYGFILINVAGWQMESSLLGVALVVLLLFLPVLLAQFLYQAGSSIHSKAKYSKALKAESKAVLGLVTNDWGFLYHELTAEPAARERMILLAISVTSYLHYSEEGKALELVEQFPHQQGPDRANWLLLKARVLWRMSRRAEAIHCFETLVQEGSMNARIFAYAFQYYMQEERFDRLLQLTQTKGWKRYIEQSDLDDLVRKHGSKPKPVAAGSSTESSHEVVPKH